MNTKLDKKQQAELNKRQRFFVEDENAIHYSYTCKCGHNMLEFESENCHTVDGVKYPFITGYSDYEGDIWYTVHDRCPKCKTRIEYSDGN